MTIQFPQLEEWQKDVIDVYNKREHSEWYVVKSIRQCGKSILAQILLTYASFEENDSVSLCISPVVSQSRKMFEDICKFANVLIAKSNGSTLEIKFINGSKILFRSAEQGDAIRGLTVKKSGILVIDEAAYINDNVFYSILVPTTNVNKSCIFIFSTPKFKKGFFFDLYFNGTKENNNIKSFDWTNYNLDKYLTPDMLEMYRVQMPKLSFASEFLGEFIDANGTVFTDFKPCIKDVKVDYKKPIYIGIDWGTGSGKDNTAITIGQIQNNKICIIDQTAFNDRNANQTIDFIQSLVNSFVMRGVKEVNIVCEKNSIGNVFYQLMIDQLDMYEHNYNDNAEWGEELEINCATFLTTNSSKEDIIKKTIVCFENQLLEMPEIEELNLELAAYECKPSKTGLLTYNAATGNKDDRVVSLCILVGKMFPLLNR